MTEDEARQLCNNPNCKIQLEHTCCEDDQFVSCKSCGFKSDLEVGNQILIDLLSGNIVDAASIGITYGD